jgi:hypothetical protein
LMHRPQRTFTDTNYTTEKERIGIANQTFSKPIISLLFTEQAKMRIHEAWSRDMDYEITEMIRRWN